MSADILSETTVSLGAAARSLPPSRRGRPVSISCLFRWIRDGVKLPSGVVVRLEAVRLGGRWITSIEALKRFADRQTPDFEDGRSPTPRSAAATKRAADSASQQLERLGI